MHFLDNLRTITQEENMETRQMTPFFSSTFSDLTVCNIHFWIWKYSKFIFMWSPFWSILIYKIPQFLTESYWFRQLITLFLKVDILRLLKIYIIFCALAGAKYSFFLGSSSWTILHWVNGLRMRKMLIKLHPSARYPKFLELLFK